MNSVPAKYLPVIVGVGEVTERIDDLLACSEPLALMEQALRSACADASPGLLPLIDSLEVIAEYSWPYADAPDLLSHRLGLMPRRAVYGETGGESPVRFLHDAALRIQRGETSVAAIVGAEAAYTVAAARKAGIKLPWTPKDSSAKLVSGDDLVNPLAIKHGVFMPTHVYPFYENATQAQWGQTQRQALEESGRMWSAFSTVAAGNPYAWLREPLSPEQIIQPTPGNRLIAWPYTKHMVANPQVNQGAAVLLTSLEKARELGIADSHCIHVWGGAAANEPRDYLKRDQYHQSHAQNAVLRRAQAIALNGGHDFDCIELYSCFPCVPKMARRTLGLAEDASTTVTGGLSFFGAPLNNYMTHAIAGQVRALRERPRGVGLLYGQGEFVTKHHTLVLGRDPSTKTQLVESYRVEDEANRARGPVPELLSDYQGISTLETFTIVYGRAGDAEFGTVIARSPNGQRLMARVLPTAWETLESLSNLDASPVGTVGVVSYGKKGLLEWRAQCC